MRSTIEFYTDKIGFDCSFEWEDPPTYAVLSYQDKIGIHLSLADRPMPKDGHRIAISIFVYDVDKVYEHLLQKGVKIHHPIGTRDYGMRDFDIIDPNGYMLTFGQYVGDGA